MDEVGNSDVCDGNTRLVVQAGSGTGDVHQIVGRYPEMDGFSYEVSGGGGKSTELSAAGWTVFVQTVAAGPDRIVFSRTRAADASTPDVQVTAEAQYQGDVRRTYLVTLLGSDSETYLSRELFNHLSITNNVSPSYVRDLLRQGADPNYAQDGVPLLLRLITGTPRTEPDTGALDTRDRVFTFDSRAEIMGMLIDAGARPDAVRITAPGESDSVAFRPANAPVLDGFSVLHQLIEFLDPAFVHSNYYTDVANGAIAVYREYLAAIARNSAARRISAPFNGAFWRDTSDDLFAISFPGSYYTPLDILAQSCRGLGSEVNEARDSRL